MGFLTADYREEIIPCLDSETLAEVLSELDDNLREEVLESVHPTALAKALEELDSDDAADVVDDLEGEKRAQVLAATRASNTPSGRPLRLVISCQSKSTTPSVAAPTPAQARPGSRLPKNSAPSTAENIGMV